MNSGRETGKKDFHDILFSHHPPASFVSLMPNFFFRVRMAAKVFFVPMARSGRIPKKEKVKEENKGEAGGCLLQVLGSREVDLIHKIFSFLDPVCIWSQL